MPLGVKEDKRMTTRVITERLLVRRAKQHGQAGCAEDDLVRLCERRDRLVSELDEVENRMRHVTHKPGPISAA
jgi:hypothetical protein